MFQACILYLTLDVQARRISSRRGGGLNLEVLKRMLGSKANLKVGNIYSLKVEFNALQ